MSDLRCPYCGGEIDELTVICRHCKKNVRKAQAPRQRAGKRVPLWVPPAVLVLVVLVILWGGGEASKVTPTVAPGLQGAIEAALGAGEQDVSRLSEFADSSSATGRVYVKFAVGDNFSDDLRAGGAQLDCTNILKAIAQSDANYGNVRIVGTFPTEDVYGNVEETEVVQLDFDAATVRKINWANFSYKDIYTVADTAVVHPQLQP